MRAQRQSGFSLIELVITIAIIGIALTVAAPSFTSVIHNRRVSSAAQDLFTTFIYARSEAIKTNDPVKVAAINDDWSNGWQVVDADNNILLSHAQQKLLVVDKSASPSLTITYSPSGRLSGTSSPELSLCDNPKSGTVVERLVDFSLSGNPRIKNGADPC